jgi:uncharacterized protein
MTQKRTTEEQQNELSWEEAVARYLEDHPDYFVRHPDTLARLTLQHDVSGRAISLIERQVEALRGRETDLNRQLRELITIARENDVLGTRLHRFAVAMLDAVTLDDVFDGATELLRQEFRLDAVVIRVVGASEAAPARDEVVPGDEPQLQALLRPLAVGKPLCGGKLEDPAMRYLFGGYADEVRSCALVPLGEKSGLGVLALGSRDPYRFHAGMGTLYLSRLGELLMHGLTRHLR